jgi:cytochrome c oxidase subunit 2
MFGGASNFSTGVDNAFMLIIGIGFFFLISITVVMIVFAFKYNKKKHPKAQQVKDNIALEVSWTVIPIILVLLMFYYGYEAFLPSRNVPKDALPVRVIGKMWDWTFDYGNGKIVKDTLVVPINKAIRLNMESPDVVHSFYVPGFRIKEDVVPGSITYMWFIAERPGEFDILCAEFCGLRHSYMEGIVKVVSDSDYVNWLANVKAIDPNAEPKGLTILKNNACIGCHSVDGSKLVGPSLKGLFASKRIVETANGEITVTADSTYIKNSVLNPDDQVVKGFNKGLMRSYQNVLTENDIKEITEYVKTLNETPVLPKNSNTKNDNTGVPSDN